jgi:heme-degrading monooxygenase HmoA
MSRIARVWFGTLQANRLEEYVAYMKATGIKDLRETRGNTGVLLLTRVEGELAEVSIVSFWESEEAIRAFAGENINKARYYPEDSKFLTELTPELRHYKVEENG